MKKLVKKQKGLARRHTRVRGKVEGTAKCPRLCVTRSNKNLYVQFVDDVAGKSICGVSTHSAEFKKTKKNGATVEGAAALGKIAAKAAQDKKIKKVVFDRGGNLYHGRIKALAESCREGGLEF